MSSLNFVRNLHGVSIMTVLTYLPDNGVTHEIEFFTLVITIDFLGWESGDSMNASTGEHGGSLINWKMNLHHVGVLGEPVYR